MKSRKITALLALLTVCILHTAAQEPAVPLNKTDYNKPKRFADLPAKMPLRLHDLESLLQMPVGSRVQASIATNFLLTGTIVSKSGPADPAVKSVVVKSSNRQGATFTFTRVTEPGGAVTYSGRLLNRAAGDALEIVKEGGIYLMRKKASYEIISE